MKCNMLLIGLSVLLLISIFIIAFSVSKFGEMYPQGCQKDNRSYPEGKVPGSYLGLNKPERDGLLTKFVMDNPNKLT